MRRAALVLALAAVASQAQDERAVTSPDGALVFRIFVTTEPGSNYSRIAYQVDHNHKPIVDTSYLGLEILRQEPYLGENAGMMDSKLTPNPRYNSLVTKYMQNGSLGRRLDVEVRVFNEGVAFRYLIARTAPVEEILIRDEMTEFNLTKGVTVQITETTLPGYPPMRLERTTSGQITRLMDHKNDADYAYIGTTPMTGPWRIISLSAGRPPIP